MEFKYAVDLVCDMNDSDEPLDLSFYFKINDQLYISCFSGHLSHNQGLQQSQQDCAKIQECLPVCKCKRSLCTLSCNDCSAMLALICQSADWRSRMMFGCTSPKAHSALTLLPTVSIAVCFSQYSHYSGFQHSA